MANIFWKIRNKTTGNFYIPGNSYCPQGSAEGKRIDSKAGLTKAIKAIKSYYENQKRQGLAIDDCYKEGFEIVVFQEVETASSIISV